MQPSVRHILAAVVAIAAAAAPVFAQARAATADPAMQRRYQIKVMEGVLVGAVRHAADILGSELRPVNPNLVLLTGMARARGFVLDGYGVFFDVEIPALRESVAWSIRTMALGPDPFVARSLSEMRQLVSALQDAQARARLQQMIANLEREVTGVAPAPPAAADAASSPRRVSSATADQEPPAPTLPTIVKDPNALYTETVKNALIDAMLDHSGPMAIGSDEWLTLAAKDAEGPLNPNEPYDAVTIVLRIKGSDLAAFRADRLTRDEARKRVEVREY